MENTITPTAANPQPMQLHKKIIIRGHILTHGGLHIGGTNTGMDIGGISAFVVREPVTNRPYIPGSSLKGKLRSLLEVFRGEVGEESYGIVKAGPGLDPGYHSAQLFGYITQGKDKKGKDAKPEKKGTAPQGQQPSRLIVRDAFMANAAQMAKRTDEGFAELKTEVVIDRITSAAMPRTMERVPHQTVFAFEMVLNIFAHEKGKEEQYLNDLWLSMLLLQDDYLGGKGSRGCGQVDLRVDHVESREVDWYRNPIELPNERDTLCPFVQLHGFRFSDTAILYDTQPA